VKTIDNKQMRNAVDALLRSKQLIAEAERLKKAARSEITDLMKKAGVDRALVRGVEVSVTHIAGRTTIDLDGLREAYPMIAEQFERVGSPYVKVDTKVIDVEEAARLTA